MLAAQDALSIAKKLMVWLDNFGTLSVCHEIKKKIENCSCKLCLPHNAGDCCFLLWSFTKYCATQPSPDSEVQQHQVNYWQCPHSLLFLPPPHTTLLSPCSDAESVLRTAPSFPERAYANSVKLSVSPLLLPL